MRWLLFQVGIRLYSYAVELQRPHGGVRTGVSRERYEEVTKRLRFCMYKRALADASSAAGRSAGGAEEIDGGAIAEERVEMVVIGHHMDDADENRLAELGKSNIVQVDGMERVSQCLGVTVLRPLLQLRKDAMFKLADDVALPYMADSTPLWSRRSARPAAPELMQRPPELRCLLRLILMLYHVPSGAGRGARWTRSTRRSGRGCWRACGESARAPGS